MADPIDVNELAAEATRRARDAAYVAVGLGLLGAQRLQARRRQVRRAAERDERLVRLRTDLATGATQVATWLESSLETAASSLEPFEDKLPAPARDVALKARTSLSALGAQLRQFTTGA
jgi:hypothetical protein